MTDDKRRSDNSNGDEELENMFDQFEDGGEDHGAYSLEEPSLGFIQSLEEETYALSQRFSSIVGYVSFIGELFDTIMKSGDDKEIEGHLETITARAMELAKDPATIGNVLIRYRGRSGFEAAESGEDFDYTVQAGQFLLDTATLKNLVSIEESEAYRLGEKLSLAFRPLPKLGIYSLYCNFGKGGKEDIYNLHRALKITAAYFKSVKDGAKPGSPSFLVFNKAGKPEANLTLLSGVNKVKSKAIEDLAGKISGLVDKADPSSSLSRVATVYDAIFLDPKLREKLKRSPVEVNNPHWMLAGKGESGLISAQQAILFRNAQQKFENDPLRLARVLDSLYQRDYRDINSSELLESLFDINELITNSKAPLARKEALARIRKMMEKAPDYLMDSFRVESGAIESLAGSGEASFSLDPDLLKIVSFFKQRSDTNEKIHNILYEKVDFDQTDYQTLALDLGIDINEARTVVELLSGCFRKGGRFSRNSFERNIPFFAKHEKKLFELLWSFLKDISSREDRVALLNSLQVLISKMKRPDIALEVILSDFISFPEILDFSERNGLMLANVLIRKYNKELGSGIERTPEEVLLVKAGISQEMASFIANFIDKEQDRFLRKMKTIHEELVRCIGRESDEVDQMSLRFLVSMEREIYIMLALSGGVCGKRIIRSAVMEYGDPHSNPYNNAKNQDELKSILGLLQLVVRGLDRFGDREDTSLFEEVKERKEDFLSANRMMPKDSVKSVMEHVSAAISHA